MTESDPLLRKWYQTYNRKYFGGSLSDDVTLFWEQSSEVYGDCNEMPDGDMVIRINPAIMGFTPLWQLTLLHEMAHLKLWPYENHGKPFQVEMLRLAALGALKKIW